MMLNRRDWLLTTLSALAASPLLRAAGDAPPVRILFFGNSFTYYNDLPETTRDLLRTSGVLSPMTDSYAQPGYYLTDHVHDAGAMTRLKRGAPDGKPWDVLVLQEQSMLHSLVHKDPQSARLGAGSISRLLSAANEANPACLVVILQVWSRHPRLWATKDECAVASGTSAADATTNIHRGAVATVAEARKYENGMRTLISPVGDFWQLAREKHPALPLYLDDGHHPDKLGTLLCALVLAGTIGGRQAIERTTWTDNVPEHQHQFETLKKLVLAHPEIFKLAGE